MYKKSKSRAKKVGLEFNLDISDIVIPKLCPVLLIELIRGRDTGLDNSPSLDRIDNTKGYIKGNVHVISNRANTLKNNASVGELGLIYKYFKGLEDEM